MQLSGCLLKLYLASDFIHSDKGLIYVLVKTPELHFQLFSCFTQMKAVSLSMKHQCRCQWPTEAQTLMDLSCKCLKEKGLGTGKVK